MQIARKIPVLHRLKSLFTGYPSFSASYLTTASRVITNTNTIDAQAKAYTTCPPVSAIINRKAKAFVNGKWWLLDKDGNESKSPISKNVGKLLAKPNLLQSWNQFLVQVKIMEQAFGECFILAIRPVGMNTIKSLWVIPNWMIAPKTGNYYFYATAFDDIITHYELTIAGKKVDIATCDILHHKDITFNTSNPLRGQSRLVALQDPVSNIICAYEARNVLMTKRGAIGILSNESKDATGRLPLLPHEKKQLQTDFRKYGITKDLYQVIISESNLKWQSMTFPTKDLMLFEEIEDDVRQVADNYDYPMYLLGFKQGSTFSNVGEAKKSLYQDSIIPEAETFALNLNEFLGLTNQGFSLQVFYDHLEVFQQSQKETAEAFKVKNEGMRIAYEMGIVTLEEWRTSIDYDPVNFNGNTFYNETNSN